ncbi:hypothetical protein RhiirA4_489184, partial [Rhizophagus irregularis]
HSTKKRCCIKVKTGKLNRLQNLEKHISKNLPKVDSKLDTRYINVNIHAIYNDDNQSEEVKEKLATIYRYNVESRKQTFNFYTDRAFKKNVNDIKQCACAFIQVEDLINEDIIINKLAFRILLDQSPETAELAAILNVLLVLPKKSKVNIYTDAKNIIDKFNQWKNADFEINARIYFKYKRHARIWNMIKGIIE